MLTALFFLGSRLPRWYSQGRLWDLLAHPVGGAPSIFGIGWALGLAAYKSKSVAGSTLTHVVNNLFNAPSFSVENRRMRSFWTAVVLFVSLGVGGCAPTLYQKAPVAFGHGYAEKKFSDDTFHVAFTANYTTSAATLREYLYRRAAELTRQHKFQYFVVIREPRPRSEYKIVYRYHEDRGAGIDAEEVEVPARGTLHMTIQCFKDARQAAGTQPIDAMACLSMSCRSRQW